MEKQATNIATFSVTAKNRSKKTHNNLQKGFSLILFTEIFQ